MKTTTGRMGIRAETILGDYGSGVSKGIIPRTPRALCYQRSLPYIDLAFYGAAITIREYEHPVGCGNGYNNRRQICFIFRMQNEVAQQYNNRQYTTRAHSCLWCGARADELDDFQACPCTSYYIAEIWLRVLRGGFGSLLPFCVGGMAFCGNCASEIDVRPLLSMFTAL